MSTSPFFTQSCIFTYNWFDRFFLKTQIRNYILDYKGLKDFSTHLLNILNNRVDSIVAQTFSSQPRFQTLVTSKSIEILTSLALFDKVEIKKELVPMLLKFNGLPKNHYLQKTSQSALKKLIAAGKLTLIDPKEQKSSTKDVVLPELREDDDGFQTSNQMVLKLANIYEKSTGKMCLNSFEQLYAFLQTRPELSPESFSDYFKTKNERLFVKSIYKDLNITEIYQHLMSNLMSETKNPEKWVETIFACPTFETFTDAHFNFLIDFYFATF